MKNYSRMTEAQKQKSVTKISGDILFESSDDAYDWMKRLVKKVHANANWFFATPQKQDKEKNEVN